MTTPFDTIAHHYDEEFTFSRLGRAKRALVRERIGPVLRSEMRVLELNCGTGEDAIWLSSRVASVLATDASAGMLAVAETKLAAAGCSNVTTKQLAIEHLDRLDNHPGYDLILSNFDGMNCVDDLETIATTLARQLRPGGSLIIVLISSFCLLESVVDLLRGRFSRLSRRRSDKPVNASLGRNVSVPMYYHSNKAIRSAFSKEFNLREQRGIGLFLPPTTYRRLYDRSPSIFDAGARLEKGVAALPPFNRMADHTLFHFERRGMER